jgi:hypothetical protein
MRLCVPRAAQSKGAEAATAQAETNRWYADKSAIDAAGWRPRL